MTIVFLGGALAGWPGVTHGGVVATIMEENMERVASRNASDKQGMCGFDRVVLCAGLIL